jgi:hypothetical protein
MDTTGHVERLAGGGQRSYLWIALKVVSRRDGRNDHPSIFYLSFMNHFVVVRLWRYIPYFFPCANSHVPVHVFLLLLFQTGDDFPVFDPENCIYIIIKDLYKDVD